MSKLPERTQVVIIGGGIIGTSLAWHLVQSGVNEVVLLERKQLSCGTTWHAAGLVAQLRATHNMTRLARYSQELYASLEEQTGQATGFQRCGAITIATTEARVEELRRGISMARCFGVEADEISVAEASERWPLMHTDDVLAAFWFPKDGRTNPTDTTQALAKGARAGGALILENMPVDEVLVSNGRAIGVRTPAGDILAQTVVNCTGMWASEFGRRHQVSIPLHAAEHYYLITEPFAGMTRDLPVLRDFDNYAYYREETGKLMLGLFEPEAAPWGQEGIPEDFCFSDLPADWERMLPWLERAMRRIPVLEQTGIQLLFNGPESFTPDDRYYLGESPELRNYFVAAGFNSVGIQSAGGAGKVLADWIIQGRQPMDLWDVNITRSLPFQNNRRYLHDRTKESLGLLYEMHWPFRQYQTARGVRKSVLHDRLAKAGACFGELAGWERANWFAPSGEKAEYVYSYGRQNWFDWQAAEHNAVRTAVGLFDQSSFSKIRVEGQAAEVFLNQICANSVSVAIGKAVYTQWLNEAGTIEADLTVTRLSETAYLIITSPFTHTHVMSWLRRHADGYNVVITDVTSGLATINLQGPRSRALLEAISTDSWSNEAIPFAGWRSKEIGYAQVQALRLTYMGELGYELYIETEFAQHVYDRIVEAGADFGLKHCGYHTLQSCRIEKAYREFGHDIGADDTPLDAGLGFAVDWNKPGGFIGRSALARQRDAGVKRVLLQFRLNDPEPLMIHNEPIIADGAIVGYTTSAMFGHTLGASIALGYVPVELAEYDQWQIEVTGRRYSATASRKPMYDPTGERARLS